MAKKVTRRRKGSQTRILIIYTGGTIGMIQDPVTMALKPFNFNKILSEIPEIQKFNFEIDAISFRPLLDSSNMEPSTWIRLAESIEEHYNNYDGFVILHGTDTLAYTSSALSYMLEGLTKPVILTGAQLPVKEVRTDAPENLITALEIASTQVKGKPVIPEVAVYFDYSLFRGNRASKYSSSKFEAFHSPNYPALAEAGVNIKFNNLLIINKKEKKFSVKKGMDSNVGLITLFPGISRAWLKSCLSTPGLKAVILQTYGSGNAPTASWFLEEIRQAISSGIYVVNISQCPAGHVKQGKYATSKALSDIGVIGGGDMTLEAATTKVMYLLGQKVTRNQFIRMVSKNICGELSD